MSFNFFSTSRKTVPATEIVVNHTGQEIHHDAQLDARVTIDNRFNSVTTQNVGGACTLRTKIFSAICSVIALAVLLTLIFVFNKGDQIQNLTCATINSLEQEVSIIEGILNCNNNYTIVINDETESNPA